MTTLFAKSVVKWEMLIIKKSVNIVWLKVSGTVCKNVAKLLILVIKLLANHAK